ncbi:MAG TPA: hypothetical protein VMF06_17825 [Candidatus Limnocylindria bacterium]|nr:hypothetical protein [Candidatus Limnocylindria bacterium]
MNTPQLLGRTLAAGLLALAVSPLSAGVLFDSGVVTMSLDPGNGTLFSNSADPEPGSEAFVLDQSYSSGGLVALGQGGMFHVESPTVFGHNIYMPTSLAQTDTSGLANHEAILTIDFTATWKIVGGFGPAVGFANLSLSGNAASGAGSFVSVDVVAHWTGASSRPDFNWSASQTTPGAVFSASISDALAMTPSGLPDGSFESIWGTITLRARGIDDESYIGFSSPSGMSPIPEPSAYAAFGAVGLAAFAAGKRLRNKA